MSEVVIRAERLRKSYKLYDTPRHRLWDMLGLKRSQSGIRLHHALSDVTFSIKGGQKVAVIGRNGAGKSTLLKLVTQVIIPTAGLLEVRGNTRALLSIGSGFHPEFSGRQNAEAYLASLGFKGSELRDLVEQAIAFAEIEDYADQPLKTYSTGMGMRIMFAAATMIKPQLLVIDEVLGVGDAYFQQKSFQHISEICAAGETTLLLVTHDIYSASQLCDRMLWIDRGRLLIDDAPDIVMRAYQDAIREQEERRLRVKALTMRPSGGKLPTFKRRILVDVQSTSNIPPPAPLHIASLSLLVDGVQIASAPMTDLAFEGDGIAFLIAEGSNWGEVEWIEGRLARPLRHYGSPIHKVTAAFSLDLDNADLQRLGVRIVCHSTHPGALTVRLHAEDYEQTLGALKLQPDQWCDVTLEPACAASLNALPSPANSASGVHQATNTEHRMSASASEAERHSGQLRLLDPKTGRQSVETGASADKIAMVPSLSTEGRYGTGDVEILWLRAVDEKGRERHIFPAGSPVRLLMGYRLRRPNLDERLTILLACKRDGVTDVARLVCDDLHFSAAVRNEGAISVFFPHFPLGSGRYVLAAFVARENYFEERQTLFFSINPGVYDVRAGLLEIEIEDTDQLHVGTGVVMNGAWTFA